MLTLLTKTVRESTSSEGRLVVNEPANEREDYKIINGTYIVHICYDFFLHKNVSTNESIIYLGLMTRFLEAPFEHQLVQSPVDKHHIF